MLDTPVLKRSLIVTVRLLGVLEFLLELHLRGTSAVAPDLHHKKLASFCLSGGR